MPKKKKKTYAQQAVGLATMGMPAPVQGVLSSRWGATIAIVAVPILIGLGILSVNWVNGMPQFSFNRDRAVEVGREVETRAIKAAQLIEQQRQQQQPSQWR